MIRNVMFLKDQRNGFAVRTLLTKIRQAFTILVLLVSLMGVSTTVAKAETFNITDNFAVNLQLVEYTITATAGVNGSITPSGAVIVSEGSNQSFTITPDTGYGVLDVLVDGASVGQVTDYEFTNVQADHTIAASFAVAPGKVTLISPEGNIGNIYQPTYVWQKVDNATWYQLVVKDPTGFDHQVWLEAAVYCNESECSVTSVPITGGSYLWWVQAWNVVFGPESDQMAFNIEPDTTITSSPPNPSSSAIATFEFESDDIAGEVVFECRLDNDEAGFGSCTSPKEYTGLSSGSHTLEVRAVSYGIPDPSPASYTWTINILPTCYALTLNHTGQGSDPIADPVNSTGCATGQYVAGATIDLSGAVPAAGWEISGWSGTNEDGSIANTNTVTMPASAHTASVTYSQIEYTLTIVSAHGTVTKSPNQATYHYGDQVTLSVVADPGWTFTGWTPTLTDNKVTITGDTTVTANYSQDEYTLTIVSAHGTVTKSPNQATYHYGDEVTLSVVADPGWTFTGWTPALTDNKVTLTGDTTVTANYSQIEYTLTITEVGNGFVTTDLVTPYHYGDVVELTAVPDPGWVLSTWSGDLTGSNNPDSITMDGNKSVTATFVNETVVSSIVRMDSDPTNAASVRFTITFSGVVMDVDTDDFTLDVTGEITGQSITDVTGSGSTRTVTVDRGSGSGTLELVVPVSATITDLFGNPLGSLPFTDGEIYTIVNGWYIRGIGSYTYGVGSDIPVVADYNGDSMADIAVFRPSNGTWYVRGMGSFTYGMVGDIPVVADYNGDGKDDIAIFRESNSTWYIRGIGSFVYGTVGDIPVVADYNGDGMADIAVFRPSNSTWYIRGIGSFVYGTVGDIPVVADYNGDGKDDIAIFRESNSTWYIRGIGPSVYGTVGDTPVVADYNGDGKADIAVFRESNSTWYIRGIGPSVYGMVGDTPVVADYNGDGKADIAVFRP